MPHLAFLLIFFGKDCEPYFRLKYQTRDAAVLSSNVAEAAAIGSANVVMWTTRTSLVYPNCMWQKNSPNHILLLFWIYPNCEPPLKRFGPNSFQSLVGACLDRMLFLKQKTQIHYKSVIMTFKWPKKKLVIKPDTQYVLKKNNYHWVVITAFLKLLRLSFGHVWSLNIAVFFAC